MKGIPALHGLRSRRTGLACVVGITFGVGGLVAWAGVALAASSPPGPSASGVFTGCVAGDGSLKLVGAGTQCPKDQLAVSWSQTGPQGPVGPAGPTGAPGPQGASGPQGAAGAQGPAGATGAAGAPGLVWMGTWDPTTVYQPTDAVYFGGSAYITALQTQAQPPGGPWQLIAGQGQQGPAGPAGPAGPPGAAGPAGPQGSPGISGIHYRQATGTVDDGHILGLVAPCDPGEAVLGGGYVDAFISQSGLTVIGSEPVKDQAGTLTLLTSTDGRGGNAWWVNFENNTGQNQLRVETWAVCATVAP